jgi:MFS family permease
MIFGTFVGSLADRMGRRKFAIIYCIAYIASCLTKHVRDYNVLLLGRLLGGIATSLLFSVLEAWMVAEHNLRSFDQAWMGDTFSKAMMLNSMVAIGSGFLANYAADSMPLTPSQFDNVFYGGNTTPFDYSIGALLLCWLVIQFAWVENYGSRSANVAASSGLSLTALKEAVAAIRNDSRILLIGSMAALFEGSMYTFVFLWTPILQKADQAQLPFGLIFAILMMSSFCGSSIFGLLTKRMEVVSIAGGVFGVAAMSLAVPSLTNSPTILLIAFMVFEACVGVYWPVIGTLKGIYVPEAQRSAIYNVFRVPLNAIVLVVLLFLSELDNSVACLSCAGLLSLAYFLQRKLVVDLARVKPNSPKEPALETEIPMLAERGELPSQPESTSPPKDEANLRDEDDIPSEGLSSREKGVSSR